MAVSHEKIVDLVGDVNGSNKSFTTPAPFISGTVRAVINGLIYPSTDEWGGFVEVGDQQLDFLVAPKDGYKMQAFMQEAEAQGSPFHPTEV